MSTTAIQQETICIDCLNGVHDEIHAQGTVCNCPCATRGPQPTRGFHSCDACGGQFSGPTSGSDFAEHPCNPIDRDAERRKKVRDRAETALREAFAIALVELGWQPTLEALGRECEPHLSATVNLDTWVMRSVALFDLSSDKDLS